MANPIVDADFAKDVLQSPTPVLVDFWAPWCGPCKAMLPIVDALEKQYEGKLKVVKMNVDENGETPQAYGVMSIPTFIIFKSGEVAGQLVGARSQTDMQKEIDAVIA